MRLDDLPPALRKQVDAKLDTKARTRNRAGAGATVTDGRCVCGMAFRSTTKWEAHSDELGAGHKRLILVGV